MMLFMRNQNLISLFVAIALHMLAFYFIIGPNRATPPSMSTSSIKNSSSHHFIISDFSIESKPKANSAMASSKNLSSQKTLSNESSAIHSENTGENLGPPNTASSTNSQLDSLPLPQYPRMAREKSMEGIVKITANYDQAGFITQVKINQSSGHQLLDDTVINTVRKWKINTTSAGNFEKSFEFKLR